MSHAEPTTSPAAWRRVNRVLAGAFAALALVAVVVAVGRSGDEPSPPLRSVAASSTPQIPLGSPVVAGDGRLYFYRGWHQEAVYAHRHPLVSDTRNGPVKIAPGFSVAAVR